MKRATARHPGPPQVSAMALICVGGCTSKAPLSLAIVPVPGASYDLRVTACVVAMCCAGSGDCGLWGGALRPPVCVCVSHSQSPWLPPPPLPVPHVVSLRTPVVCASSSGSCKVRVVASQLVAGDHAPSGAPAGERHGVVFICVGGCTSKAPLSPALALCPVQAVACA